MQPFVAKKYEDIVQDILDQITHAEVKEAFIFKQHLKKYELSYRPFLNVISISGINSVDGERRRTNGHEAKDSIKSNASFFKEHDYVVEKIGDRASVFWNLEAGLGPKPNTEFIVTYKLNLEPLLTDTSAGSVIRTIVESVSREIEFLYGQLDRIYKSGFIETATGTSLDKVAAILGRYGIRYDGEDDNSFRERASRALYFSGKATLESLVENLKREVKGIHSYPKIIENKEMPGIITVLIDGKGQDGKIIIDETRVNEVINKSKAAGVHFKTVYIDIEPLAVYVDLKVERDAGLDRIHDLAEQMVNKAFSDLEIGQGVSDHLLTKPLYQIPGVLAAEAKFQRPGHETQTASASPRPDRRLRLVQLRINERT